jgi:peptide methionine sulfoxide reductase MsrB
MDASLGFWQKWLTQFAMSAWEVQFGFNLTVTTPGGQDDKMTVNISPNYTNWVTFRNEQSEEQTRLYVCLSGGSFEPGFSVEKPYWIESVFQGWIGYVRTANYREEGLHAVNYVYAFHDEGCLTRDEPEFRNTWCASHMGHVTPGGPSQLDCQSEDGRLIVLCNQVTDIFPFTQNKRIISQTLREGVMRRTSDRKIRRKECMQLNR